MSDSQSNDDADVEQQLETYEEEEEEQEEATPPPSKKTKKKVVATEEEAEEEAAESGGGGGDDEDGEDGKVVRTMKHDKICALLAGHGIKRSEKKVARWESDDVSGYNAIVQLLHKRDTTVGSASTAGRLVAYDEATKSFVLVAEKNRAIRVVCGNKWDNKEMKKKMPELVKKYRIDTSKYRTLDSQTFALIEEGHIKTEDCVLESKLKSCVFHDRQTQSSVWLNLSRGVQLLGPVINCGKVKSPVTRKAMETQLKEITKTRRELLRLISEAEGGGGGEAMVVEETKTKKKSKATASDKPPPKKKARIAAPQQAEEVPAMSGEQIRMKRLRGLNSTEIGEFFAANRRELCTRTSSQKERERLDWFAKYQ